MAMRTRLRLAAVVSGLVVALGYEGMPAAKSSDEKCEVGGIVCGGVDLESKKVAVFATLDEVEASPGPGEAKAIVVAETKSIYVFSPGDSTPSDRVVVLGHKGGQPGRWIHSGEDLVLSPLPSGDDAAHVAAILEGNAGRRTVVLSAGTYNWETPCRVPSGTRLRGGADVTINSKLPNNGVYVTAAFLAFNTAGTSGHPESPIAIGDTTIKTTTDLGPVGTKIIVVSPNFHVSVRTITGITQAGGAYELTIDRPVLDAFATTDTITTLPSVPHDIDIDGRGMTVTGTGVRFFEFIISERCTIRNLTMHVKSGVTMDLLASFDVGGVENRYENVIVKVDQGAKALAGLAVESNESTQVKGCAVTGPSSMYYGIAVYDSHNTEVSGTTSFGAGTAALGLDADANSIGCRNTRVVGGVYSGALTGIRTANGTSGTVIQDVDAQSNVSTGIQLGCDGVPCDGAKLVNVNARKNGDIGISTCCGGTQARNIDISSNGNTPATGRGLLVAAGFDGQNITSKGGNGTYAVVASTSDRVRLSNMDISHSQVANVVLLSGAGEYEIRDSAIAGVPGANGIHTFAKLLVSGTRISGTGVGLVVTAGTARLGAGNDFDGATLPTLVRASGRINQGTAQLTSVGGISSVTVAWPDLKSTDRVNVNIKKPGGTPGSYQVAYTPGTGFTITSTNPEDTSLLDWDLGRTAE
ncbi:MAG: hypothetical protein HYZ29_01295 [Myxococcales bacterium]|nr:hypothetical protein [Myxococcales bacterium]